MALYYMRKGIRKLPGIVIKAASLPEPTVTEGFGSRAKVGELCERDGISSVLLVTDKTLFELGYYVKVRDSIEKLGIKCTIFSDISSEPTFAIIEQGRSAAISCGADCIVALGGGSVLDSSKIIAASAKHPARNVRHYLHKFALVPDKTLPMISIPSTAGTGAEYTVGAVVKDNHGVKKSTVVIGLNVTHVILDSELMVKAPREVTVWCGIDALSHGLEGVLADVSTSFEDEKKSFECVRLILANLPMVIAEPENIEARQNMSRAAYYGGNAINKQLAGYVHAFAHSIGAVYHLPHGEAIALCLVPVIDAQKDRVRDKLAALALYCGFAGRHCSHEEASELFLTELRMMLDFCGTDRSLPEMRTEDYDRLVSMIDIDSINYSPPKTFKDEEIRAILDIIRKGGRD